MVGTMDRATIEFFNSPRYKRVTGNDIIKEQESYVLGANFTTTRKPRLSLSEKQMVVLLIIPIIGGALTLGVF